MIEESLSAAELAVYKIEEIFYCNQHDTEDGVPYENNDEEAVAMIEESPSDGDFGKYFLSSWKSAKTGKDQIDFDVESVPRNKKTAINFDKLDDFELGGDFDKLSSFKMDMPNLDFSSPIKKSEKSKGKSCEEIVPGKKKAEQDKFSFSFSFNELDTFDIDPNLMKGRRKLRILLRMVDLIILLSMARIRNPLCMITIKNLLLP